jgi:hypothetical protein
MHAYHYDGVVTESEHAKYYSTSHVCIYVHIWHTYWIIQQPACNIHVHVMYMTVEDTSSNIHVCTMCIYVLFSMHVHMHTCVRPGQHVHMSMPHHAWQYMYINAVHAS